VRFGQRREVHPEFHLVICIVQEFKYREVRTAMLSVAMRGLLVFALPSLALGASVSSRQTTCGTTLLKQYTESNTSIVHLPESRPEPPRPTKYYWTVQLKSWYDCPSVSGTLVTAAVVVRICILLDKLCRTLLMTSFAEHRYL
jgi:hypothetical protein